MSTVGDSMNGQMDPAQRLLQNAGVVLAWEEMTGTHSELQDIRTSVAGIDSQVTLAVAAHWNCLLALPGRIQDQGLQGAMLSYLWSTDQKLQVKKILEANPHVRADAIVNPQQLLILARLILEGTDWDALPSAKDVDGPTLFNILLKINDQLDIPPTL